MKLKNVGKKNIEDICGIVCEKNSLCYAHKKLRIFKYFTEEIRERNLNKNIVASKIYIKDNCKHPYCLNSWCIGIYETKYISSDKSLSYRASKYL